MTSRLRRSPATLEAARARSVALPLIVVALALTAGACGLIERINGTTGPSEVGFKPPTSGETIYEISNNDLSVKFWYVLEPARNSSVEWGQQFWLTVRCRYTGSTLDWRMSLKLDLFSPTGEWVTRIGETPHFATCSDPEQTSKGGFKFSGSIQEIRTRGWLVPKSIFNSDNRDSWQNSNPPGVVGTEVVNYVME